MAIRTIPTKCARCKGDFNSLWPIGGNVCSKCLVKHHTREEALKATCSCHHAEINRLFDQAKK